MRPTIKSAKKMALIPNWLRLCKCRWPSSPLLPTPSDSKPQGSPTPGCPLALGSRWQCPVFSFPPPSWRSLVLGLPGCPGKTGDRQWQSVQPKGPNQLCPHSCSEGFHQTESGEACKGCIVEEHNVEIAQPVEASKITQKVKASES